MPPWVSCAPAGIAREAPTEARAQAGLQCLGPLQPMPLAQRCHVLVAAEVERGGRAEEAHDQAAKRIGWQIEKQSTSPVLCGLRCDARGPFPTATPVTCRIMTPVLVLVVTASVVNVPAQCRTCTSSKLCEAGATKRTEQNG